MYEDFIVLLCVCVIPEMYPCIVYMCFFSLGFPRITPSVIVDTISNEVRCAFGDWETNFSDPSQICAATEPLSCAFIRTPLTTSLLQPLHIHLCPVGPYCAVLSAGVCRACAVYRLILSHHYFSSSALCSTIPFIHTRPFLSSASLGREHLLVSTPTLDESVRISQENEVLEQKQLYTTTNSPQREVMVQELAGFLEEKKRFLREVCKWDDSANEIVVLAKKMCVIMMEMTDFTRSRGPLKTTMDVIEVGFFGCFLQSSMCVIDFAEQWGTHTHTVQSIKISPLSALISVSAAHQRHKDTFIALLWFQSGRLLHCVLLAPALCWYLLCVGR